MVTVHVLSISSGGFSCARFLRYNLSPSLSYSIRHFIVTNYGKTAVIHACSYNVIICDFTRH